MDDLGWGWENVTSVFFFKDTRNANLNQCLFVCRFTATFTMDTIAATIFGIQLDSQTNHDHPFFTHSKEFGETFGPANPLFALCCEYGPRLCFLFHICSLREHYGEKEIFEDIQEERNGVCFLLTDRHKQNIFTEAQKMPPLIVELPLSVETDPCISGHFRTLPCMCPTNQRPALCRSLFLVFFQVFLPFVGNFLDKFNLVSVVPTTVEKYFTKTINDLIEEREQHSDIKVCDSVLFRDSEWFGKGRLQLLCSHARMFARRVEFCASFCACMQRADVIQSLMQAEQLLLEHEAHEAAQDTDEATVTSVKGAPMSKVIRTKNTKKGDELFLRHDFRHDEKGDSGAVLAVVSGWFRHHRNNSGLFDVQIGSASRHTGETGGRNEICCG